MYSFVIKLILEYQLKDHELFLSGFNSVFRDIDDDKDGLVDYA